MNDIEIEKHIDTVPMKLQGFQRKALHGQLTSKQAIKACCQECVGFEDYKTRIIGCASFRCPLHKYRPYVSGLPKRHSSRPFSGKLIPKPMVGA